MAHSKNFEYFYTLLDQYKQIAFPDFIQEETSPLATIEQLGTVDHVKFISDQQVIDIVVSGCKCIGHQSTLSRPFYQFLYKQFSKQIRVTNFRSSQFDIVIHYMLDGLEQQDEQLSDDCKVDLLRALSALVFETANNAQRSAGRLAKLLMTLANPSYKSLEVRRMAINCIGNLCVNGGSTKLQPFFQDLYACLLSNLCKVNRTSDGTIMVTAPTTDMLNDTAVRKIASSTLRAIQFLLSQDKSLVTNPLCDIIDIVHSFIFMHVNVPSYSVNQTGNATRRNKILPSPPSQPAFPWRMTYQMKSMSLATSSESELSDSTTSVQPELSPRRQRDYAKIRINALLCLSAIASTSPKVLYSHWSKFLPDTFSIFLSNNTNSEGRLLPYLKSDNQPYSLFTILIYDPMVHVRSAVCNSLIAMLDGSKHYLSLALESDKHKSSFTSLSENLGSMIHDIHQAFIYSLDKEQTTQVLTLIMQAIVLLVENCSYERLSKSHLPSLYHAIKAHWKEPSKKFGLIS
ncbi:MAG: hypothetical protein EXX96DRAFT_256100 [Benjaminiella poitrasii]|nr:MAG: hypothetical protein EXX96DRAFT_256100 [Benjaminiella poitrasii]